MRFKKIRYHSYEHTEAHLGLGYFTTEKAFVIYVEFGMCSLAIDFGEREMPEHNEEISTAQAKEMGLSPGKYVWKICGCGYERAVRKRRYTMTGPCKECTQREFHRGKA